MTQATLQQKLTALSSEDLNNLVEVIGQIVEDRNKPKAAESSLSGFAENYFAYVQDVGSQAYLRSVKLSFKHLMNHFGANRKLSSIGLRELEGFVIYLKSSAPKGYLVYIRNLKAAFERAIKWEMLESNLFKKLKFRKTQKAKPTFILRKDLDLLLANAKNPDIMDMMIFSINTGCRLSEVVWLRWANISFEANEITLGDAQFETKSRKQRIIPISAEVGQMLAERKTRAKSEYVFSKENGSPYSKEYVSKCFKAACSKTGLGEEFHFHCLRHSFASILAMKGTPTFVIKEIMGHSSINTTEIYAHVNKESLHNAITSLN